MTYNALGQLTIRRASHVEPDEWGRWTADLTPIAGPLQDIPPRSVFQQQIERVLDAFQQRSLPLLVEFCTWLVTLNGRVLPKSPVGHAIHYVLPAGMVSFATAKMAALAIDNNLAERTLRPCAIGRKNWNFLGNDRDGRTAAVLFSFTASCKANQVEPWAYLRDVITQLADRHCDAPPTEEFLTQLLPDVWLRTHPEAHRPWSPPT